MFRYILLAFGILSLGGCCLTAHSTSPASLAATPSGSEGTAAAPLLKRGLDLTRVVLNPKDLAGLFPPSYAIRQPIDTEEVKGLVVTYQTESIPHTLAFAKGFSTRIEIYEEEEAARLSFAGKAAPPTGAPLVVRKIGDETTAFRTEISTPEGFVVPGNMYVLVFRCRQVLVSITVKINQSLSPDRLEALGTLVLNRLLNANP